MFWVPLWRCRLSSVNSQIPLPRAASPHQQSDGTNAHATATWKKIVNVPCHAAGFTLRVTVSCCTRLPRLAFQCMSGLFGSRSRRIIMTRRQSTSCLIVSFSDPITHITHSYFFGFGVAVHTHHIAGTQCRWGVTP